MIQPQAKVVENWSKGSTAL